jgi:nicotinamide riboside transporter PnuC
MTHHGGTETRRRDLSPWLCVASVCLLVLSYLAPVLSVHTYCENRSISVVLLIIAIILFVSLLRNRAGTILHHVLARIGEAACVVSIAISIAFIWYATESCKQTIESLDKLK